MDRVTSPRTLSRPGVAPRYVVVAELRRLNMIDVHDLVCCVSQYFRTIFGHSLGIFIVHHAGEGVSADLPAESPDHFIGSLSGVNDESKYVRGTPDCPQYLSLHHKTSQRGFLTMASIASSYSIHKCLLPFLPRQMDHLKLFHHMQLIDQLNAPLPSFRHQGCCQTLPSHRTHPSCDSWCSDESRTAVSVDSYLG